MLGTSSCMESTLVNHQRSDAFYANQKYLIPKSVMSLEGAADTTSQSYINGTSHSHENQPSDPNLHSITKPIKHEPKPYSQGRPEDLIQELAKLAKGSGGDRPLGDDQNIYPDHHQHEPTPAPATQTQLPQVSPPAQPAFPSEEPAPKGGDLAESDAEKEVSTLLNVALANKAGRGASLQASPFKDASAPFPIGNSTGNFPAMGGFTPQQQQSQSLSPQEKLESSHSIPDRSPVRANPEPTSTPNPHPLDNQDKNRMFPPPGVIHVTPTSPGLPETTTNAPTISSSQPLPSYSNMAPHQGAQTAPSGTTTPTEASSLSPQDNMGGITSTPKVSQQDPDGSPPEGASRSSFEDMNMSQDLDKSNHMSDYGDDYGMKGMDSMMESWGGMPIVSEGEGGNERFYCHLCSYVGTSQYLFRAHMNSHFEHNCPHCDYTSRTEGRLKKHIKDFHSDSQNATDNANRTMRTQPGRPKVFRCKQCEFVSTTKEDFWIHSRIHIKAEKILQCPKCPFVTEYKHHLEYHLRNHFGSKPFKCNKCNYSCVNKSMLNSHMKSHTNVYQYRCADCTYATKYCHSLKLHLQKYNHKPATVLNPDGSLPVDGSGDFELVSKRGPPRGPRGPRKDSPPHESMKPMMPRLGMNPAHVMNGGLLPSPFWPLMGQLSNGFQGPPPLIPVSAMAPLSVNLPAQNKFMGSTSAATPVGRGMKCNWCDLVTDSPEKMNLHVLKVHGAENQDLLNMFGLHGDLMEETAMKHARLANASEDVKSLLLSPKKEMSLAAAQNLAARRSTWHGDLAAAQHHQAMMMGMNKEQAASNFRSPQSHSPASEAAAKQQMARSEGITTKGMPLKSNKEKSDYPLDLSRSYPMYMDSEEDAYDQSYDNHMDSSQLERESQSDITRPMEASPKRSLEESAEVRPRKRSRKGKAYKLDRLCMRLQDNASMSPSRDDSCDEYVMSDYMGGAATQDDAEGHAATSENISSEQALVPHASGDSPQEELQSNLKELHSNIHALNGVSQEEGEDYMPGGAATDKRNMSSSFSAMSGEGHDGINPSGPRMDGRDPMGGSNGNMTEDNNSSAYINHLPKSDVRQLGMGKNKFECTYCEIIFKDCIMYTMHMGYHGYKDPFKCNMCGHQSGNKVEFFLHIARAAHE